MNEATLLTLAATLAVLVATSGLLASVETSVTRIDVVRALRLDEEGRRGAASLLWLVEHRGLLVDTVLLVTIAVRVATTVVTLALVDALAPSLAPGVRIATTIALVVIVSMALGEVAPRTVATRWIEPVGLAVAVPARLLVRALGPLARVVAVLGRAVVPKRANGAGSEGDDEDAGDDDVGEVVDDEVEPEERRMIRSIFGLGDTIAREIMVPRPDMVTVAVGAPLSDVLDRVVAEGRSRLPVHAPDDVDTFVGVVHAKDLLARLVADAPAVPATDVGWADLVREPTFFPETKRADDLLRDLQESATHLALLVDEYGSVVGLVTIEDILEEIVGEIVDEHDEAEDLIERLADGRLRIDGRLPVDELAELLGVELPEEPWDTAGGLVFGSLGRVPRPGDRLELEGVVFVVERTQGRRVAKLLVDAGAGPGSSQDPSGPS